ncbi:MAG TPA: tetratricopeptide repeat protein [Myxococcota bacterium]|nr:tetratricopeptide repeat protein [Myxococcota bacterium]
MERSWKSRLPDLALALGLALATLWAYYGALDNGFVHYDDTLYVTRNPVTQQGLSRSTVLWAFTTGFAANWHPLTWLSVMLDVQLFGLDARGHHATSIALHVLNTVLVFVLMLRLGLGRGASALAAGLFGLHPLHVESVAWVAERKDVLSMLFGLLTLLVYIRYSEAPSKRRMAAVAVLLALGLMAKPVLVTLPFVLLLLDWWPLRRIASPSWLASPDTAVHAHSAEAVGLGLLVREKSLLFALALLSCFITYLAQAEHGSVAVQVPAAYRVVNAVHSYIAYLVKTFYPLHLAVFYPLPPELPLLRGVVDLAALAALTVLAWRVRTRAPYLLVGLLWFLGTLVPMIGLVQVGMQAYADRYTYFPSLGLGLAASLLLADLARGLRLPSVVSVLAAVWLLGSLAFVTAKQTLVWRDTVTLFEHAIAVTGRNPVARLSLAGELVEDGQLEQARSEAEQALAEGAPPAGVHLDLGSIAHRQYDLPAALREFDAGLALKPDDSNLLLNRGIILTEMGRYDEAISALERVVAQRAGNDSNLLIIAHRTLGQALQRVGRNAEAIEHMRESNEVGTPGH